MSAQMSLPPWSDPSANAGGYQFDIPPDTIPAFQRGPPPVPDEYYSYDPNGAMYSPRRMSWGGHRPRMPQIYTAASAPAQLPPWSTLARPQPLPGSPHYTPYNASSMSLPAILPNSDDGRRPGMYAGSPQTIYSDERVHLTRAPTYHGHRPLYQGADIAVYDDRIRAARPSDWRPDYKPARGLFGRARLCKPVIPSPVRAPSRTRRGRPHALLEHHSRKPPALAYNLRHYPLPEEVFLPAQQRYATEADLYQLALVPAAHDDIFLFHKKLPWLVRVRASNPIGITVRDVLEQLCGKLHKQIQVHHVYNVVLNGDDRAEVIAAYRERCGYSDEMKGEGIKRIDFLGADIIFCGIAKGRNGLWEIKTCPRPDEDS
ncbi:hypothetical protein EV714DRAFT_248027 [Schizophyllum commune]